MRKGFTTCCLTLGLLAFGALPLRGQESQVEGDDGAAEAVPPKLASHPEIKPTPPPGEEIMRSTARGFRFTRKMCGAFARNFVADDLNEKVSLNPEQKRKLTEAVDRRAWDLNTRLGAEGVTAIESFYEALISGEGNRQAPTPEAAKQLSEKIKPGLKIIPSFWDGLIEDARPLLSPQQMESLADAAREVTRDINRFDKRLDRWARGEVKENESLLDGIGDEEPDEGTAGKSKEYANAERSARWQVRSLGPEEWSRFLGCAATAFAFDDVQKAAGQKLLRDYREKAKSIMTEEWRAKATANQVRRSLQWMAPKESVEPWIFRLDQEYKQMTKPLEEMGRAFRREVIQIATHEQRNKVIADLQKSGADRGMPPEEAQAIAAAFPSKSPQTQPEGH